MVVVYRKPASFHGLGLAASITNPALIHEDGIVLLDGQLVVVHQTLGARCICLAHESSTEDDVFWATY